MVIQRANTELLLRPDGTLYLPELGELLLADLHLGKAETFQRAGIPVPASLLNEELSRVAKAIRASGCRRVTILGDLLHHPTGVSEELYRRVSRWRSELPVPMQLVPGNHDRGLEAVVDAWDITLLEERGAVGPFLVTHDLRRAGQDNRLLESEEEPLRIGGHLHPVVELRQKSDKLRLRCFLEDGGSLVLPAFARFAGGAVVTPGSRNAVYAIAEGEIIPIKTPGE